MKNLTFKKVFWTWFVFDLAMIILNDFTVKSSLLASVCHATIGVFLFFYPIAPLKIQAAYGEEKSKSIMRILGVLEIVWSFILKINF